MSPDYFKYDRTSGKVRYQKFNCPQYVVQRLFKFTDIENFYWSHNLVSPLFWNNKAVSIV